MAGQGAVARGVVGVVFAPGPARPGKLARRIARGADGPVVGGLLDQLVGGVPQKRVAGRRRRVGRADDVRQAARRRQTRGSAAARPLGEIRRRLRSARDYPGAANDSIESFARGVFDTYGVGNLPKNDGVHCPKCEDAKLTRRRIRGTEVVVDVCPNCNGLWFDRDELNQVLSVAAKDLKPPSEAKEAGMRRPRCRAPLVVFYYPQTYVKIDMCGACNGLWLNPGELREIKVVRTHFQDKGELEEYAPVVGIKGDLLPWVNSAIKFLSDFE